MRQLKKCTLCPAITKQPVRHINKVHKDHPARYKSTPLQFKYTQVHEICVHLSNNQILYCTVYSSSSTPLPTTWGENLEHIFFFFLLIQCSFDAYFLLCFTLLSYRGLNLRKNFLIVFLKPSIEWEKKER